MILRLYANDHVLVIVLCITHERSVCKKREKPQVTETPQETTNSVLWDCVHSNDTQQLRRPRGGTLQGGNVVHSINNPYYNWKSDSITTWFISLGGDYCTWARLGRGGVKMLFLQTVIQKWSCISKTQRSRWAFLWVQWSRFFYLLIFLQRSKFLDAIGTKSHVFISLNENSARWNASLPPPGWTVYIL